MKDIERHTFKLRSSGLRPTKQRLLISRVMFDRKETFHFTIKDLNLMIKKNFNLKVSLATIYNSVHAFKKKGYLKEIPLEGNKTYFDTNTSKHHHFYDEDNDKLIDINDAQISINRIPSAPGNNSIKSLDVMVRVANENHNHKK